MNEWDGPVFKFMGDNGKTRSLSPRIIGFIIALALGDFLFLRASSEWTNYWLLKDGQQGMAVVTEELWWGHNAVDYKYTVNQEEYSGRSTRNRKDPKYRTVQPGDESVVYYSASHPWLSRLYKPTTLAEGWPVVILAFVFEMFAIITIINPKSGWAYDFGNEKRNTHGTKPGVQG